MAGLRLIMAFLTLGVAPAFADTCVIAVPVGPGWNTAAIYNHELAHCNRWKHAHYNRAVAAYGYQGEVPPRRFVHPYAGEFEARFLTPADTRKLCKSLNGIPSNGCQWFE